MSGGGTTEISFAGGAAENIMILQTALVVDNRDKP